MLTPATIQLRGVTLPAYHPAINLRGENQRAAIKYGPLPPLSRPAPGAAGFAAIAQTDPKVGVTVNDPSGRRPIPAVSRETLPKDIKCTGQVGKQQMSLLYGRSSQAPPVHGQVIWYPGNFSKPHYHNNERFAMSCPTLVDVTSTV